MLNPIIEKLIMTSIITFCTFTAFNNKFLYAEDNQVLNESKNERNGPLKNLPSREGSHIEKIKSMNDNSWINLGRAAADPKWGEARGRSWCQKMNLAPDIRGAYFTGEGVHAYIKPDGYYMDDHFVYNLNTHSWICLHPGVKAGPDQGLKIGETGLLVNSDGDPIPCGLLAHNYDQTTYDEHQKKFAFIPKGLATGWWITMKCDQVKEFSKPASELMKKHNWSPWYFNISTGKFERETVESKGPTGTTGSGCFTYLAKHKKFFLKGTGNWLYDAVDKTWQKVSDIPKDLNIGYDTASCYDTKRGLVYIFGGNKTENNGKFASFDAASDTWEKLPDIPGNPRLTGNSSAITYDSANDVLVVYIKKLSGFFFFDAEKKKWINENAQKIEANQGGVAFYDPQNNAHYFFNGGDSKDKGEFWVYRYKNLTTK